MLFNSFEFLIFFPVVIGIYYIIPKKLRQMWLLVASYYFYMCWNAKYAILIFGITLLSFLGGKALARMTGEDKAALAKRKRRLFVVCAGLIIGILLLFKYLDFTRDNINRFLQLIGSSVSISTAFSLVLPVGISFYTFQALGYLIDVYRGDVQAEENFAKYALFVSFFPQLVAGPIERSKNLLNQLGEPKDFDYERARNGLLLMLWGFFEKMWIADTAAIYVNKMYDNYWEYSSGALVVATVFFAIQIYCDFSGYSHIAIGAAQVLGVRLMDNFRQPYFATSIKDFWRRWHISLSTWFRDYVYIPLGGSRCSKLKTYRNLMITFLVSGLWHGANWTYVLWGGLHGVYQVIGAVTLPYRTRLRQFLHIKDTWKLYKLGQMIVTFFLCDLAWLFFRAESVSQAVAILRHMCSPSVPEQLLNLTTYTTGLSLVQLYRLFFAVIVLLIVGILHEHGVHIRECFCKRNVLFRWICYVVLLTGFCLLIIQEFGGAAAEFIYFQF